MTGRDLSPLFAPASVAVLGASNDETKYGNWISGQALRMPDRPVYLVNRSGATVLGRPTYRSMAELPGPAELVVIAVPASGFERAVADALDAGARAIVGITAGFAELGVEGRAVQERVTARVRAAGALLLGPNCLGVADASTGLTLAANPLPPGRVSLLSQSGNMALEVSGCLAAHGLGLARFASLGNQADLGVADLVEACVEHDGTDLIAVYCEDFGDGRAFVAAAARASVAGKPVLLLTVGGSEASVRGARSHTGSLTSDSAVIDAACRAGGVYRVAAPRELADLAAVLSGPVRPRPPRRVGVIADGGGHASVASDVLEADGLAVPEFPAGLATALRADLPPSASVANPVDLAGAGEQDIASFARVLDAVLAEPELDGVLVSGYFGGYREFGPGLAAAELDVAGVMADHVKAHGKPVAVHTMHAESPAARLLAERGVPVFRAVQDAARALSLLASGGEPEPTAPPRPPARPVADDGYWASRELLRTAGIDFPAAELVASAEEAVVAAARIGHPVVVKALGLLHKSDAGGVALGLAGPDAVRAAVLDMSARLDPPGFCVERMATPAHGVELIAGVRTDPRFGPVAMVGLGGVFTEVLRDVAFALAPVTETTAERLLTGLRAAAVLRGARGRPAVDIRAASRVVAALSALAAAHPEIAEIEVNPLLATPDGALALDARLVLAPQERGTTWSSP